MKTLSALALSLCLLAPSAAAARGIRPGLVPKSEPTHAVSVESARPGGAQDEAAPEEPAQDSGEVGFWLEPTVEFALSDKSVWLAYRSSFATGLGYWSVGGLVNDDDDVLVTGRVLRMGEPLERVPLALGGGISLYTAFVDEPDDQVVALTLTGNASYLIETQYPMRVIGEFSIAPDITTWADGDDFLDARIAYEVQISKELSAFLGYRLVKVDLDDDSNYELEDRLHGGVRLTF